MQGRHLFDVDRATISPLSHALTLGITTLLIVGLTVGASGLLQNERQSATREDLRTIGNRLAGELTHVDQLAQRGGTATIQSVHTERVAGKSYAVRLLHGSVCDRTRITAETCLRLSVNGVDVTEYVPVRNESLLSLESQTSGRFVLSAELQSATDRRSDVVMRDLSTRVGVGEDVTRNGEVIGGTLGNQPPLADFEFEPTSPQAGQQVRFNASASLDPDGSIQKYEWDWNGDGTYTETTTDPVIDHTFSEGGNYYVDLRVTDEEGTSSNITRFIDVSGLVYNDDLTTGASDSSVTFTVTNNFDEEITVTHVLVDPSDDSIDEVSEGVSGAYEVEVDPGTGSSGTIDSEFDLYTDGRIQELESETTLSDGESATVSMRYFWDDGSAVNMDGHELRFGLKYEIDDRTNSTRFTDVIGGPTITNYRLEESGGNVNLVFKSTQELEMINVDYGGDTSETTLSRSDFDESTSGSGYEYETTNAIAASQGLYWAELTTAETGTGVASGQTPINDTISTTNPTGDYVWTTTGDWDAITDSTGVVHASFGDHSADEVELGYSNFDEGGSNLVGYWPLDDPTVATEASGVGNDGVIHGGPSNFDSGIGNSSAYLFDGSDDYIQIPDYDELEVSDEQEVTVSSWVYLDADQSGQWTAIFQNSDESYNMQIENDQTASFRIYDTTGTYREANYDIDTDRWVHVVGVFDRTTWVENILYVNGEDEAYDWNSQDIDDSGSVDPGIAENIDNDDRNLDGQIDELRVYDRALSEDEVETLYETPTQGEFTTGWQSGDDINQQHVELQYDVDVESGEEITIRVVGQNTNGGQTRTSNDITIDSTDPEQGTRTVSGLNGIGNGDRYRLEVELTSSTVSGSPTVHSISLEDTNS